MKMEENQEIKKLWMMPLEEFNSWRRQNDLPNLLEYFKKTLPHFTEWQEANKITDQRFLASDRPSNFFIGDSILYYAVATGLDDEGKIETKEFVSTLGTEDYNQLQIKRWQKPPFKMLSSEAFKPYFFWLRKDKKIKKFKLPKSGNTTFVDDLSYMSWQGGSTVYSRAYLFHDHQVLKLGGVTITPNQLDERNLDFVDLDGLSITRGGWTRSTEIAYSSCRNIRLHGTSKAFLTFERCQLENFSVTQSKVQNLHFIDCQLISPVFKDSKLPFLKFIKSVAGGLDIQNCELHEFYFSPPKGASPQGLSECYRRLRNAFQQKGDRKEVSRFYYLERFSELRDHFNPFIPDLDEFTRHAYIGSYFDLYDGWKIGLYSRKQFLSILKKNVIFYLKVFLIPKNLSKFLYGKFKLIGELLDWSMWGFGERPGRVFLWMLLVILSFTAKYYYLEPRIKENVLDALSCSTFNFATMGCDYKVGIDSVEGILGAIFLGLMVAGFSNRTRY